MREFRLALCDDEPLILSQLRRELKEVFVFPDSGRQVEVDAYAQPSRLLASLDKTQYDVFFLDIDMPQKNGIELAAEIKERCPDVPIVFISGREEFVFDSFRVHPFAFVRKRMLLEDLKETARDLIRRSGEGQLTLEDDLGVRFTVQKEDLLYVEAMDKYVLVAAGEEKLLRCALKKVEKQLPEGEFLRCHKSFVVHVTKIASVRHDHVTLVNGKALPIRRGLAMELKRSLADYLLG